MREMGNPVRDFIRFQALAGSGLPSKSAIKSSHLALQKPPDLITLREIFPSVRLPRPSVGVARFNVA